MKEVIDLLKRAECSLGNISGRQSASINRDIANWAIAYVRAALEILQAPPHYETPEQYKKRTGKEWRDNWAVYYSTKYGGTDDWEVSTYSDILEIIKHSGDDYVCEDIIVATELGCPPDGWKPEDEVSELS